MTVQLRVFMTDPEIDLEAYVVVDSLVDSRAMGGTRMTSTVDMDEVANLAHNMTLKLALAGLPIGGAKAGIRCGLPAGPERDRCLEYFGHAIAPLLHGGIYLGVDQGITFPDRNKFLSAAHFEMSEQSGVGVLPCSWSDLWQSCSDITGFGICEGLDAASHLLPLSNDRTVVIQGFGAVGRGVAIGLEQRGFRIVAIADREGTILSTDGLPIQELIKATDVAGTIDRTALRKGVRCIDESEAWLQVPADVLVLAANGNAVNADNVHRVQAQVIVEGGNFACAQVAHQLLAQMKVPVLPAIVVNAGGAIVTGLILSNMSPQGLDTEEFVRWLYAEVAMRIRRNMDILLRRATLDTRPLSEIAETLAMEKLEIPAHK